MIPDRNEITMMSLHASRRRRVGRRRPEIRERGFTLVEALIALTISGIVATALVSLLLAQSRFYQRTDDQMAAEQAAQATFELVSSEIRMAGAADLMEAESDSLTFRFDLFQAIVCDATGSDEVAMHVFERTASAGLTSSFVGIAVSGPFETGFEYEDSWDPTPSASGSGPRADCVAAGGSGSGPDSDYLRISGWTSRFTTGVPQRGALVRQYGKVTYKFAPSSFFATRWALWRGTQELVGPFEAGAAFAYVMNDGSVQSSVGASDFSQVVAVRLTATAVGEGTNRFDVERPIVFDVPFRN